MNTINTKVLFHKLCDTMDRLDRAEVDINTANAQAKIVGQINNLLNYELKRAALMTRPEFRQELRHLESKNFDSLPS
jgi:hypothetical protein